jgi:hypothetical protein
MKQLLQMRQLGLDIVATCDACAWYERFAEDTCMRISTSHLDTDIDVAYLLLD